MAESRPRFGRYEVVRLIGKGGMAAVFEGVHPGLAKRVAIKALLPSIAALPGAKERFVREGRAAARVRHPHVVDVTDMGEDERGRPYLVMEYLEGETLADYFRRRAPLPVERLVDFMLPVVAGVAAGHEEGVVHRDLKPQNLFLARDARGGRVPKVLDFGLSRLMDMTSSAEGLGPVGLHFGTTEYLAPEQASAGGVADGRSDQYALGLILYEGATGTPARRGGSELALWQQVLHGEITPPRALRAELPEAFESTLLRALAREPDDRFASLYALGEALIAFASPRGALRWQGTFGG
jgi:serine/threonine-protein kinase